MLIEQGGTGDEKVDDTWFFEDHHNFALEDAGGCIPFVYDHRSPTAGVYDIHFLFPLEVRGLRALISARAMLREAFTTYHATRITGAISRSHRAARWFIRQLGFAPVGTLEHCGRPHVRYVLEREIWLGLPQ